MLDAKNVCTQVCLYYIHKNYNHSFSLFPVSYQYDKLQDLNYEAVMNIAQSMTKATQLWHDVEPNRDIRIVLL